MFLRIKTINKWEIALRLRSNNVCKKLSHVRSRTHRPKEVKWNSVIKNSVTMNKLNWTQACMVVITEFNCFSKVASHRPIDSFVKFKVYLIFQ